MPIVEWMARRDADSREDRDVEGCWRNGGCRFALQRRISLATSYRIFHAISCDKSLMFSTLYLSLRSAILGIHPFFLLFSFDVKSSFFRTNGFGLFLFMYSMIL